MSQWQVGGKLHEGMIAGLNADIAAIQGAYPDAVFMGFTCQLGSNDAGYDPFHAKFTAHLADLRSRVFMNGVSGTTAEQAGVIHVFLATMPERSRALAQYHEIDAALRDLSFETTGGRFVTPVLGNDSGDHLHPNAAGVRANGTAAAALLSNTRPSTFTLPGYNIGLGDPYIQQLTATDEDIYWYLTGADAAEFEVLRTNYNNNFGGADPDAHRFKHYLQRKAAVAWATTGTKHLIVNAKNGSGVVYSVAHIVKIGSATLASPTDAANGSSGANIGVTVSDNTGTIYWAILPAASTAPTQAAIVAGTGAIVNGNIAVSSSGAKTATPSGLSTSTAYKAYFVHQRSDGQWSAVVAGDGFTTGSAASSWIAYHNPALKADTAKGWGTLGTTTGDGTSGAGLTILGPGGYSGGKMLIGGPSIPPVWSAWAIDAGRASVKIRQVIKVGGTYPAYLYGASQWTGVTSGDDATMFRANLAMGTDGTTHYYIDGIGSRSFGTFPALRVGNTYTLGMDIDSAANTVTFLVDGVVVLGPVQTDHGDDIVERYTYVGAGGMYYDTGYEFGLFTVAVTEVSMR